MFIIIIFCYNPTLKFNTFKNADFVMEDFKENRNAFFRGLLTLL